MKAGNSLLSGMGATVFAVFSALAAEHRAINLGQGFPDDRGPEDVLEVAARSLLEDSNQYAPMMGLPILRQALAEHGRRFYGLSFDPDREIMATSGATEALAACLLGLIEPGDEIVLIEPFYDSYLPIIQLAGGVARTVRLEPPSWSLTRENLARAFSSKTKAIVLNNPMNPAGKVFSRDELEMIAECVIAHDAYAVCDEVYEHIVFDGKPHIPLITLPGMRDRCLKVASAGKIFSLTGWKIGAVSGCERLLHPASRAHQYLTFSSAPNLQKAVAYGLNKDDAYFSELASTMQARRDRLRQGLQSIGFDVLPTEGAYFLIVDIRSTGFDDDVAFCRHITTKAGVAAIPVSAFYAEAPTKQLVRFCFCKQDSVLDEAVARLRAHFSPSPRSPCLE
ncbi:putative N-succinyldiaminopimelate aminotransferase DapC [Azospirillaceae bacterium]